MTIYFLSDGEYIKIGYTKQDVYSRINSLQTGNARELVYLGEIPGNIEVESNLHNRFKHLRVKGEWFKKDIELIEYIKGNTKENTFFTALNAVHKQHPNYPKELFTIAFKLDDNEVYVSIEHYPGGWMGAMYDGVGSCMIDNHIYVPLSAVEFESNKTYEQVRTFHQSAYKKLQNIYSLNRSII